MSRVDSTINVKNSRGEERSGVQFKEIERDEEGDPFCPSLQ